MSNQEHALQAAIAAREARRAKRKQTPSGEQQSEDSDSDDDEDIQQHKFMLLKMKQEISREMMLKQQIGKMRGDFTKMD
jgi:hypothetical protein